MLSFHFSGINVEDFIYLVHMFSGSNLQFHLFIFKVYRIYLTHFLLPHVVENVLFFRTELLEIQTDTTQM